MNSAEHRETNFEKSVIIRLLINHTKFKHSHFSFSGTPALIASSCPKCNSQRQRGFSEYSHFLNRVTILCKTRDFPRISLGPFNSTLIIKFPLYIHGVIMFSLDNVDPIFTNSAINKKTTFFQFNCDRHIREEKH